MYQSLSAPARPISAAAEDTGDSDCRDSADWIKPDGSFRSRRLHLGWDNVPMHRWGQSQMFRALALLFRRSREKCVAREIGRQMSEIRKRLSQVKEHNSSVDSNADQKSEGRDQMSEVSGLNSMISE